MACSIMSTAVGITLTAAGTAKSMAAKQQVCGTRFNGSARTCGFAVPNTQLYAELICEEEIVKLCGHRTNQIGVRLRHCVGCTGVVDERKRRWSIP